MGTYVVGDIHGCYNEWIHLKNRIESEDKEARFILVGDIVDRGINQKKMIDWALENITPDGKYRMVLGNHEEMKLGWLNKYSKYLDEELRLSTYYRGFHDKYNFTSIMALHYVTDEYVKKALEFFKSLPLYIELEIETFGRTQKYIICHAAIPDDCIDENGKIIYDNIDRPRFTSMGLLESNYLVWERNYWGNSWEQDTIVVHGHTPTACRELFDAGSNPGYIDFKNKDINVDCACCFDIKVARLAAIRLEDLQEFYSDNGKLGESCGYKRDSYKEDMLHLLKTGENKYDTLMKDDCLVSGDEDDY